MKTVLVNYTLPAKPSREAMLKQFVEAANEKFKDMPGLFSKQFSYDETTGNGQSVYLWQTEEQANAFFSPEFPSLFRGVFGVEPTITGFDTLVVVDNRSGEVLSNN